MRQFSNKVVDFIETIQILSQYKGDENVVEIFIETILKVGVQNSFEQTLADSYAD